jgi:polyisoprenoid-binding protein YceI
MKTISSKILWVLMLVLPGVAKAQQKTLAIDTQNSTIEWTGKKVLGQHNGTVNFKSGKIMLNGKTLTGGAFTIDLTSITNLDLKDADYNQKLIGHLKSPDFFNVAQYPEAAVAIKKVEKYKSTEGKYKITADVTIKGITNTVVFDALFSQKGNLYTGNATILLDRTKWDIQYGSSSFFDNLGDKAIKNEIELNVKIQAG